MNLTTKKIIIGTSIVVGLGVIGYFVFKRIKKNKEEKEQREKLEKEKEEADKNALQNNASTSTATLTPSPTPSSTPSLTPSLTPNNTPLPKDLETAINTIVNKASGDKSNREFLLKADKNFVFKWAYALNNKLTAFTFANFTYRTKNAQVLLQFNPIDKIFVTPNKLILGYLNPNVNSGEDYFNVNTNLGKCKYVKFDGKNVWLYFPKFSDYKWFKANDIILSK